MEAGKISRVAVLGAGTMGTGLALVFAEAGFRVSLYSIPDPTLDRALSVIRAGLETLAAAGRLDASRIREIMDRIVTGTDLAAAVGDNELFIEAVSEKLEVKKALFAQLDALCPTDALFVSNTSFLNIFPIVPERRLPNTAIAHFFAPAHIVPLVEVVCGEKTSEATVEALLALLRKAGRVPVLMKKYIPGFCINRIQSAIGNEVYNLLDNGYISPEDLDLAVKASLIPRAMVLGLVQRYDFTGLDLTLQNLKNNTYQYPPPNPEPDCLAGKAAQGNLGVKTGRGFYDYSGRSLEEVLAARDMALLQVLDGVGDFIYRHI
ncbi:MAG: 3-hydroxyacyl-CoA dehydrogenase family protein [Deltaproteobacteria bacterium]|jgi:3-hydroxybutyryl-CoA dehydrogenase|nr:3-hydroxyacyl-CoA dehydrogenase family protein [Deltaproteobacteria bacterium]